MHQCYSFLLHHVTFLILYIRAVLRVTFIPGDESDLFQQDLLCRTNPEKHKKERCQVLNTSTATWHWSFKQVEMAGMFFRHPEQTGADVGRQRECLGQACLSISFPLKTRSATDEEGRGKHSGMFYRWRG